MLHEILCFYPACKGLLGILCQVDCQELENAPQKHVLSQFCYKGTVFAHQVLKLPFWPERAEIPFWECSQIESRKYVLRAEPRVCDVEQIFVIISFEEILKKYNLYLLKLFFLYTKL